MNDGKSSLRIQWHDALHKLTTNPAKGGQFARNRAPHGSVGHDPECWPSVFQQTGFPDFLVEILSKPCRLVMPRPQLGSLSFARFACLHQDQLQERHTPRCVNQHSRRQSAALLGAYG
jgi:hypothetical protein